ncbi:carboxypeptidase M32 [Candidatus Woesearchaeota archaeon]|nr:carboxypeptidase M32 [Candidatus Woesearchaeota archaeon]
MRPELKEIYRIQKELKLLSGINALLGWDQNTYMPENGCYKDRAEQFSVISRIAHKKFTSPSFQKLVNDTLAKKILKKDRMVLCRLKKDIDKAKKLPPEYVEEEARVTGLAYSVWREAKNTNNFKLFKPHLKKIIELKRTECKLKNLPGHPYNSLLDDFEEDMTTKKLKETFAYLRIELVKLLNEIKASKKYRKNVPEPECDPDQLRKLCDFIRIKMQVTDDRSRMDATEHPFTTTIGPDDVRITTNYKRGTVDAISSTIHEAGHALYNLGLPKKYRYTALWGGTSLGMHESQSRFWEKVIGTNPVFWKYMYPILKQHANKIVSEEDLVFTMNNVKPSFIRVAADEITYNLHIILRFEIELDLIEGNVEVRQLPKLWKKKMKELLGVVPKTDTEGVLQDVHWSHGILGYFPTYTLGNIYASQLYYAMIKDNPKIMDDLQKGNYDRIIKWMRKNVHKYGRTLSTEQIVEKATGEGLNPRIFVKYLREKFTKIYDL